MSVIAVSPDGNNIFQIDVIDWQTGDLYAEPSQDYEIEAKSPVPVVQGSNPTEGARFKVTITLPEPAISGNPANHWRQAPEQLIKVFVARRKLDSSGQPYNPEQYEPETPAPSHVCGFIDTDCRVITVEIEVNDLKQGDKVRVVGVNTTPANGQITILDNTGQVVVWTQISNLT